MIQSLPKNRFSKGKKSILDAIWTIENIKNHQTENPLRNLHEGMPVTIVFSIPQYKTKKKTHISPQILRVTL